MSSRGRHEKDGRVMEYSFGARTLREAAGLGGIKRGRERQLALASMQQLSIKAAGTEAAITSLSGGNEDASSVPALRPSRKTVIRSAIR